MCTSDCLGLDGEAETWSDDSIMKCVKCSDTLGEYCKKCLDGDTCLRCIGGYMINSKCETICPEGYFGNNDWKCELCSSYIKHCTKCTGYNYCTECEAGNLLIESTHVCETCHSDCSLCTEPKNRMKCTQCYDPLKFLNILSDNFGSCSEAFECQESTGNILNN